jgi:hypothetical protein
MASVFLYNPNPNMPSHPHGAVSMQDVAQEVAATCRPQMQHKQNPKSNVLCSLSCGAVEMPHPHKETKQRDSQPDPSVVVQPATTTLQSAVDADTKTVCSAKALRR